MDPQAGADQHTVKLTDHDIERRKRFVGLENADLRRIAAVKPILVKQADEFTEAFFDFLRGLEEASPLFHDKKNLDRARSMKREHLIAMGNGVYDRGYVEQRLALGFLYGRVGLDTRVFIGAFHHLMRTIGEAIMANAGKKPLDTFENFMSLKKIGFFDIGLIVDVMVAERERPIIQQQETIRELSTPTLQVRDQLLILPVIGVLDTIRAQQLTESLLEAIQTSRAKMVVMDVTGVAAVDSMVANHLIETATAAQLMGTQVIISGLSPSIAQTMGSLGVDLGTVTTVGDLQGGLELAERYLGYRVVFQAAA